MLIRESREVVVNSPYVKIFKDRVRDGKLSDDYYVLAGPNGVMVFPLTIDNQVVLIREYRYGCQDYVWQLPSGGIDGQETAAETAKRELLEETGYHTESLDLLGDYYVLSERMPDRLFAFVARECVEIRKPKLQQEEISVIVVDLDVAVKMVMDNKVKDPCSCMLIAMCVLGNLVKEGV